MTQVAVVAATALAAFGAGLMTTVAGLGGGVALLAGLAFFLPPQTAVVLVAPILMVGNTSRLVLFRKHVDGRVLRWFLVAAIPAAVAGGLVLPFVPSNLLQTALGLFMLAFVATRLMRRTRERTTILPAPAFLGVGAVAGVLSATVGASGPFIAPFLEARGLERQTFVGTMAGSTTGLNAAKMTGYMAAGLLSVGELPELVAAMVGITVGNYVGRHVLGRVTETAFRYLLLTVVGLSGVQLLIR